MRCLFPPSLPVWSYVTLKLNCSKTRRDTQTSLYYWFQKISLWWVQQQCVSASSTVQVVCLSPWGGGEEGVSKFTSFFTPGHFDASRDIPTVLLLILKGESLASLRVSPPRIPPYTPTLTEGVENYVFSPPKLLRGHPHNIFIHIQMDWRTVVSLLMPPI